MRELGIILPTEDNDRRSLAHVHRRLRRKICRELSCGVTASRVEGVWLNPKTGQLVDEECFYYTIAANCADADRKLRNLAVWAGRMARQEAMYLRYADGSVEIIDIEEEIAAVPGKKERRNSSRASKKERVT